MAEQDLRSSLPDIVNSVITKPLTAQPTISESTNVVVEIIDYFRMRKAGRDVSIRPWHSYKLQPEEYKTLIRQVKKERSLWGYVDDKLRFDYDPRIEILILRMPSNRHKMFLSRVVSEISSRLRMFENAEGQSKAFAQKVSYDGGLSSYFKSENNNGKIRHDPDAIFRHEDAYWPGVIIEISDCEKTKALPRLAEDYILGSDARIRVVVGLDIDNSTKKATISLWRPTLIANEQVEIELWANQTLCSQVFRDESGNPNLSSDAGLRLELKDFAPPALAEGISDSFLLDSASLCQLLCKVEEQVQMIEEDRGVVNHLPPGTMIWHREKTTPGEFSSEGESDSSYQF